jgi:hypothetical protein
MATRCDFSCMTFERTFDDFDAIVLLVDHDATRTCIFLVNHFIIQILFFKFDEVELAFQ